MLQTVCAFYSLTVFLDKSILKMYQVPGLLWGLEI